MAKSSGSNPKQIMMIVVAVAALAVAGVVIMRTANPPSGVTPYAYYYNVESGQLVVDRKAGVPPFNLPPEGLVRAAVFSCGDCGDASTRFIGWLESYSDAALAKLRQASGQQLDEVAQRDLMFETGTEKTLSPPPGENGEPRWMPFGSPEASAIQARVAQSCQGGPDGGNPASSCVPGPGETP